MTYTHTHIHTSSDLHIHTYTPLVTEGDAVTRVEGVRGLGRLSGTSVTPRKFFAAHTHTPQAEEEDT